MFTNNQPRKQVRNNTIFKKITPSWLRQLFSSQLRLNMLSGTISMGLGLLVSAIKYPLYIHFLGYEHYGVWLLLSTILTFAQMGLLGIAPAIIKYVAEEYGKNNHKAIQEYFITALYTILVFGMMLLGVSIFLKEQIILLLGLGGENVELFSGLFTYMVIFSIVVLAYQVLNAVLSGIGRIDVANYSQTALQILPLIISVPLLLSGKGIISLLLANYFAYLIIFSFNFIKANEIAHLNLLNITSYSWLRAQKMLAYGSNILIGSMLSMMLLPITKIFFARTIGIEVVPVFELAYRISMQLRSVFEVAFRALMPEVSKFSSVVNQKNVAIIKKITSKSYRLIFLGATPLYLLTFMLAKVLFKVWLGGSYIPSTVSVFRVMLLVSFVSLLGVIPYYINMGCGKVRTILIHHVCCTAGTLISLGVIIVAIPNINVVTVAWCFLPGTILGTVYLLNLQNGKG